MSSFYAKYGTKTLSFPASDPNVINFINRVTAAGGTLSTTEINALYTYVGALKQNLVWNQLIALYPFVGGSGSNSQSVINFSHNLVSPNYQLVNVSNIITGPNCSSYGWQQSSNGYWNTQIIPSNILQLNNVSISFYSRTSSNANGIIDMGSNNSTTSALQLEAANYSNSQFGAYDTTTTYLYYYNTNSLGFFSGSRISSTNIAMYIRGSQVANSTASNAGSLPSSILALGCVYTGAPSQFTSRQYTMFSIGYGFTSAQEATRYTIQQAFETTLGRNV